MECYSCVCCYYSRCGGECQVRRCVRWVGGGGGFDGIFVLKIFWKIRKVRKVREMGYTPIGGPQPTRNRSPYPHLHVPPPVRAHTPGRATCPSAHTHSHTHTHAYLCVMRLCACAHTHTHASCAHARVIWPSAAKSLKTNGFCLRPAVDRLSAAIGSRHPVGRVSSRTA